MGKPRMYPLPVTFAEMLLLRKGLDALYVAGELDDAGIQFRSVLDTHVDMAEELEPLDTVGLMTRFGLFASTETIVMDQGERDE